MILPPLVFPDQSIINHQSINHVLFFRLLVGAPAAESGQPGIHKGGAVYKCEPDNPGHCDLIPFDTKGEAAVSQTGR